MKNKNESKAQGRVPKLRFPEFEDYWEYKVLGPFLEEYSERVSANTELPIYSSTRTGLIAQKEYYDGKEVINEGEYGIVPEGYFVYRHMSDDATFKFNINKTGFKIAVSKEYPVFKTVDLDSDFLLHKLNDGADFKRFAIMQEKGGTRTRLYFKTLSAWKALLPSLPEQQKIADCLSSIGELIAAYMQKLEALKMYKKGLMQKLFPTEGETVPKLRFPEFRDAGEWKPLPIEEKIDLLTGYPFDGADISEDSRGVRLMRGINITEGFIRHNLDIDRYFLGNIEELEKYKLLENDLVIGMDGSKVGRNSALITHVDAGSLLVQRVARLRADSTTSIQFIFQQINSNIFHTYVDKINTSGGIPHISAKQIIDFQIYFPSIGEQQKIADCLSSLDELIVTMSNKLESLKAHKKGLMQQLFPLPNEVDE